MVWISAGIVGSSLQFAAIAFRFAQASAQSKLEVE
jgi:hypothetical protein